MKDHSKRLEKRSSLLGSVIYTHLDSFQRDNLVQNIFLHSSTHPDCRLYHVIRVAMIGADTYIGLGSVDIEVNVKQEEDEAKQSWS